MDVNTIKCTNDMSPNHYLYTLQHKMSEIYIIKKWKMCETLTMMLPIRCYSIDDTQHSRAQTLGGAPASMTYVERHNADGKSLH